MKETCIFCDRPIPGKRMTNGDRIRAMSDEELAAMLYSFEDLEMPDYCQRKKECDDMLDGDIDIPDEKCINCLIDWLRQQEREIDNEAD
jgi:hypothetical protein